ncbi:MAG: transcriptional regulator [Desulfobacterales bacterium]|nr:MAG: transcriptional regulator [Desulfobacterales bacterium]
MERENNLPKILADISDAREMEDVLVELLTPREMKDLAMRWQLLKELHRGEPQRAIAERHGLSLCKITRGSRILKKKNSAIMRLLQENKK